MHDQDRVGMLKLRDEEKGSNSRSYHDFPLQRAQPGEQRIVRAALKLRATPLGGFAFLHIEQLKAENIKYKAEKEQMMVENGKLQVSLKRKHEETKPKAAAICL